MIDNLHIASSAASPTGSTTQEAANQRRSMCTYQWRDANLFTYGDEEYLIDFETHRRYLQID